MATIPHTADTATLSPEASEELEAYLAAPTPPDGHAERVAAARAEAARISPRTANQLAEAA